MNISISSKYSTSSTFNSKILKENKTKILFFVLMHFLSIGAGEQKQFKKIYLRSIHDITFNMTKFCLNYLT